MAGLVAAAVVRIQLASSRPAPPGFLGFRRSERQPWYSADGTEVAELFEGGGGETPAYETVAIEMASLPEGKIGVNIQKERRLVSRVLYREAFMAGWRVGDDVVEVNGRPVESNADVRSQVRKAIEEHGQRGTPLRFVVRRWATRGTTRGMVRMSSPRGMDHFVPMLDLTLGLLQDYPVVLFMEGSLENPAALRGPSLRAVELLDSLDVAFKAVDCADEKVNPGLRDVVQELSSDSKLPQLFVGGKHLNNGLRDASELRAALHAAGAFFRERAVPS